MRQSLVWKMLATVGFCRQYGPQLAVMAWCPRPTRKMRVSIALSLSEFHTDSQGRRIRSQSNRDGNDGNNKSNENGWSEFSAWDAPDDRPTSSTGNGWDDFDPLSTAPTTRKSRSREFNPPRTRDFRRNSGNQRGNSFNRNSNYDRRGGGGGAGGRKGPYVKDDSQKKINLKALEGAGYDHLYGLAPVRNALRAQRREFVPLESRFLQNLNDDEEGNESEKDATIATSTDERKPEAQFRPYLFLQDRQGKRGGRKSDKSALEEEVQLLAEALSLPIAYIDKGVLNTLSSNRPHQGCVLRCGKLDFEPLSKIPIGPDAPRLWLVLDQIVDPQNLGGLLRSAYFFGNMAVLVCAKNSAPPSSTVSASSAGALEDMIVFSTRSLPRTLADAAQEGCRIIGASASSPPDSNVPVYELDELPPSDDDMPILLVLGSEGHGIRPMVASSCTEFVKIPGASSSEDLGVDSLNVSVTGGILMWHLVNNLLHKE